ncbi:MAG: helix-turn-helix domain-containing protein [Ruminococcaceae bacterium]|nr:helix-turn-helix domain-containing protein [Oscillospiraceae bacterium]
MPSVLASFGISECFFKRILLHKDDRYVTKKWHHHNMVEIHAVEEGTQTYEINSETVVLTAGSFMVIKPRLEHRVLKESSEAVRSTIVFEVASGSVLANFLDSIDGYAVGNFSKQIIEDIVFICSEKSKRALFCYSVIENRILEFIFLILRCLNLTGSKLIDEEKYEDSTVSLVKRYVKDNIRSSITLSELSSYCYMSEKQLTRIFRREMDCTVAEYVRSMRCRESEKLLKESDMSIKQISEYMGFNNEFYFNSFFKKHSGLTPGEYRKAVMKNK